MLLSGIQQHETTGRFAVRNISSPTLKPDAFNFKPAMKQGLSELSYPPHWVRFGNNITPALLFIDESKKGIEGRISSLEKTLEHKFQNNEPVTRKDLKQYVYAIADRLVLDILEKDPITEKHSNEVAKQAKLLAIELVKDAESVEEYKQIDPERIRLGGLLHDLGKLDIGTTIIQKPGKLTLEEREEINTHPLKGAEYIMDLHFETLERLCTQAGISKPSGEYSKEFYKAALEMALFHHLGYNGQGQISGSSYALSKVQEKRLKNTYGIDISKFINGQNNGAMKGKDIPVRARIVAIADSYDAMTTNRGYNLVMTPQEACGELLYSDRNDWYDQDIVKVFTERVVKVSKEDAKIAHDNYLVRKRATGSK